MTNNLTKSKTHNIFEHNSSSRADQTASQPSVSSSSLSGNFTHSIKSGQSGSSSKSKNEDIDQETVQSSTKPDPGYHIGK